ncbi:hypothetical protein SCLCIDRAFT_30180 [Scleroderma citrinum Foug A]|uniref:Uncharacterized protein n=1 Tax=Scleroderma citrinum Foug A TaxID=1036808 RepID=A0A0C3D4E2_9AGAM|nr:hypothetical protein SCLCIDRAFT_30180 [Scleroderma citrinum Foug A]
MLTPTSSSTLPVSENAIQPAAMESLHTEHIVAHVAQQLTSYTDSLSRSGNPDYWWKVVDVVWHELTLVRGVVNHLPAGFVMPTHLIAMDHFMTDPVTVRKTKKWPPWDEVASRWHMALCTDCNSRNASSVLSNIAPSLPRYPGFKGLEVGRIALRFDTAVSMAGCIDPMEMFRVVSAWLRGVISIQPCRRHCLTSPMTLYEGFGSFAGGCAALACSWFEFDSATSTATPDESIQMLCMVDRWLHRSGAFQVQSSFFRIDAWVQRPYRIVSTDIRVAA